MENLNVRFVLARAKSTIVMHDLGRYRNSGVAETAYTFDIGKWVYGKAGLLGPWTAPAELSYTSSVADRFRLACATEKLEENSSRLQCIALAQYEEYVSILWILTPQLSPDYISATECETLLREVDRRMTRAIGKSTPETNQP